MYLSRVQIDDRNRQKIRDLTHLGAYHNWVESSFPEEIAHHRRSRHLWRIDILRGKRYLLIVSEEKPDSTRLEQYGVQGTVITKGYQAFIDKIRTDEIMNFCLVANPTYRTNGKVYPHITIEQQKNWLLDRMTDAGFEILPENMSKTNEYQFDIVNREWPTLYHNKRRVRLSRVTFEGRLKVTNVDKIKETLINGVGREKAYGMGMLTVIPVRK
ncbi:type I-E CRISPR-associated protein Cas6/Cse3/CasE [Limosilactobacillus difficilis]|uniref:type I-E CRISPR-associated protein Cas6/Cse3/CasE n=1 Tax=Limosilactobacillus difficilis TaxID=2991838 RepID=UPI0024BBB70E|nr:type I-E CRISPR-associated protein Cas6/Cse3/CasE [Limosilactobacillus difficilis]